MMSPDLATFVTKYFVRHLAAERNVSAHTTAKFSHGVCPDCFPKMFPGVDLHSHSAS